MSLLDTASLVVTPNGTKASKLYSVVPSSGAGDLDVTRATTATRVNSSGLIESVASNVPRLDYTNGSCPSILVEPQRTNVLLRSQEFDNVAWLTFRSSVSSNATISPDGTTNAEKLIQQSGANDAGGVYQSLTIANSTVYTYSFFAKADGFDFCFLRLVNLPSDFYAWFNLSTGAVGSTIGATTSSSIVSYGNGWYRCSMTFTSVGITAVPHIYIANSNGSDQTPGANGVKGIFAYGAQLEAGSYATSYIPTTSASVTRNADVISKTGISSLIGQTEGTIYWEGKANNFNGSNDAWLATISIDNTSTGLLIYHIFSTNQLAVFINNGTTNLQLFKTLNITQNNKIAVAYKSGQYALFVNGVLEDSSTNSMLPASSVNKFHLNEWNNSAKTCTTETKLSALWKTRLTNTQLAQLTTI
jgi:hypothetical protein